MYKGFYKNVYDKFELYLFRLFRIAQYCENNLNFTLKGDPEIREALDGEYGCKKGFTKIPPNPFLFREEDKNIFNMFFDRLECESNNNRDIRQLLREVWHRINIIKKMLGMTKYSRFRGKKKQEERLLNKIDLYIRFPESFNNLYHIILGDDEEVLRVFQYFLKDVSPNTGIKLTSKYRELYEVRKDE